MFSSFIGAILNEVPKDDQPSSLDFAGSTVIAVAESKEEILEILKNDVYVKEGVWDLSKVCEPPYFVSLAVLAHLVGVSLRCLFAHNVPGAEKINAHITQWKKNQEVCPLNIFANFLGTFFRIVGPDVAPQVRLQNSHPRPNVIDV